MVLKPRKPLQLNVSYEIWPGGRAAQHEARAVATAIGAERTMRTPILLMGIDRSRSVVDEDGCRARRPVSTLVLLCVEL